MSKRRGRHVSTYGGKEVRVFDGVRYFFDSVSKKKSWAKKAAERERKAGRLARVVPMNQKGSPYKYKIYVRGKG